MVMMMILGPSKNLMKICSNEYIVMNTFDTIQYDTF